MQATDLSSRAWVEVDLDALRGNAEFVRRTAGPAVKLLPMVKADAYGLGMAAVARALADAFPAGAIAGFGVACVAEGETLRAAGWPGRILVFSPALPSEFARAAAARLTLCLSDLAAVRGWAVVAAAHRRRFPVHIEIDTGIGRAGFPWDRVNEWASALRPLVAGPLRCEGVFTHFHSADEPGLGPTHEQWDRFGKALAALRGAVPEAVAAVIHVANSAAAVRCALPGDWVRPGIFLYGGRVGADPPRPVVSVRARLVLVREVPAGTTVGYGATYRARRSERWGTLSIGYGDGLRRALGPAGGGALVRGKRVPIVGRVSMDVTVVDLTEVPDAAVGDVATLVGRDGDAVIDLDAVAEQAGTISYEVLTGLGSRLPRVYSGEADGGPGRAWPAGHAAETAAGIAPREPAG